MKALRQKKDFPENRKEIFRLNSSTKGSPGRTWSPLPIISFSLSHNHLRYMFNLKKMVRLFTNCFKVNLTDLPFQSDSHPNFLSQTAVARLQIDLKRWLSQTSMTDIKLLFTLQGLFMALTQWCLEQVHAWQWEPRWELVLKLKTFTYSTSERNVQISHS